MRLSVANIPLDFVHMRTICIKDNVSGIFMNFVFMVIFVTLFNVNISESDHFYFFTLNKSVRSNFYSILGSLLRTATQFLFFFILFFNESVIANKNFSFVQQ